MKRLLIIWMTLLFAASAALAAWTPPESQQLRVWYPFATGTNSSGQYTNAASPPAYSNSIDWNLYGTNGTAAPAYIAPTGSLYGYCQFYGTNTYLNMNWTTNNADEDLFGYTGQTITNCSGRTVSIWVYMITNGDTVSYACSTKNFNSNGSWNGYFFGNTYVDGNTEKNSLGYIPSSLGYPTAVSHTNTSLFKTWQHLAFVCSPRTDGLEYMNVYTNGVQVSNYKTHITNTYICANKGFNVGKRATDDFGYFCGYIGQVMVWATNLSPVEIADVYTNQARGFGLHFPQDYYAPFSFANGYVIPGYTNSPSFHTDPFAGYLAAGYLSGNTNASMNLKDWSVNKRDATNWGYSAGTVKFVPVSTNAGRVTYAQQYDGSANSYILIPGTNWLTNVSYSVTSATLICWYMVTTHATYSTLIGQMAYNMGGGVRGREMQICDGTTANGLSVYYDAGDYSLIPSKISPSSNTWHYCGLQVVVSNKPVFFVDGTITNGSLNAASFEQDDYFALGVDASVGYQGCLKGYTCGARIYTNCIFTASDFTNDMNWSSPLTNTLTWPTYPASTSTVVVAVFGQTGYKFNDPYSNYWACAFFGDTNASGYAVDYSGYARHASNTGNVTSVIVGTNINGRVQKALVFGGTNFMTVGLDSQATNFLNGVTSVVIYSWVYVTNYVSYAGIIYANDPSYNVGLDMNIGPFFKCYCNAASAHTANQATNAWLFVSSSWGVTQNSGAVQTYVNAVLSSTPTSSKTTALNQRTYMRLGYDDYDPTRKYKGYIGLAVVYTNYIPSLVSMTNFYNATYPPNNCLY